MHVTWDPHPRPPRPLSRGRCSIPVKCCTLQFRFTHETQWVGSRSHSPLRTDEIDRTPLSLPQMSLPVIMQLGAQPSFDHKPFDHTKWQELYPLNMFKTRVAGLSSGPATAGRGRSVGGCLAGLRRPWMKATQQQGAQNMAQPAPVTLRLADYGRYVRSAASDRCNIQ